MRSFFGHSAAAAGSAFRFLQEWVSLGDAGVGGALRPDLLEVRTSLSGQSPSHLKHSRGESETDHNRRG